MFKAIIVSGLVALAAAQSSVLTFTHVPNPVTDGQAQAITYSTNDTTSPVTIILRKGLSGNLQTVQTLTAAATSGQYIWTPAKTLPNGDDYALEITQGTQINYFGPFVVQGASASASISSSAVPSASITVSANGTASTTVPLGTGVIGTASAATGTGIARNTTMSMATLTAASSASSTAGSPTSNTAGTTTTGSGSGSSSSTASASASKSTSGASQIGSATVLMLGAVAAVFYLQ